MKHKYIYWAWETGGNCFYRDVFRAFVWALEKTNQAQPAPNGLSVLFSPITGTCSVDNQVDTPPPPPKGSEWGIHTLISNCCFPALSTNLKNRYNLRVGLWNKPFQVRTKQTLYNWWIWKSGNFCELKKGGTHTHTELYSHHSSVLSHSGLCWEQCVLQRRSPALGALGWLLWLLW